MKFLVLAAVCVASVNAACDFASLLTIASGANSIGCTSESGGYSLVAAALPTAEQYPKLCVSTKCQALLTEIKTSAPAPCTIKVGTRDVDIYALVNPIEKECAKYMTTSAPPTTTPSVTPAPAC